MEHSASTALEEALELLNADKGPKASAILAQLLNRDPNNERAWHMLSFALVDPEKRAYALRRVLQINPDNRAARAQLKRISEEIAAPKRQPPTAAPRAKTQSPVEERKPPVIARPVRPQPQPAQAVLAPRPARQREVWKSSSAQATSPDAKILPFPGTRPIPRISRTRWQRLKIRIGLARRRFKDNWAVFAQSRLAVLGLVLIALFGLMAIAHPILLKTIWPRSVYDPVTGFDMKVFPHPSPPGPGHILGTDTLGRDVLSMLLAATTPTFVIGLTAALTTAIIGTILSTTAAYFRGPLDALITNLADVFLLFPAPVIMVIIGARFRDLGPVPLGLIYGLVTGAGGTVLVLRAHALQVVSKPYMEAAHIAGGGAVHMIIKHLLPAMLPLAALQMMIAVTGAVVADGFISFFGLTRSVSNWGTIIYDAFIYGNLGTTEIGIWHMLLPAAICFSLFALGFYLVSRGLHRVAAPTIREERPGR
ncbi:MAG: ABC transporter permease subunit [Anaerolineae bacterium]